MLVELFLIVLAFSEIVGFVEIVVQFFLQLEIGPLDLLGIIGSLLNLLFVGWRRGDIALVLVLINLNFGFVAHRLMRIILIMT